MVVQAKIETSFKLYKNKNKKKTDVEKEWENLQNILKSKAYKSLGKIKRRNKRKCLKIRDGQIKELIQAKKTSHKKWLAL